MKTNKYPGAIFYKLSLWEKVKMWFWGILYGRQNVINFVSELEQEQEVLDKMYKMYIDQKFLKELPPINIKE